MSHTYLSHVSHIYSLMYIRLFAGRAGDMYVLFLTHTHTHTLSLLPSLPPSLLSLSRVSYIYESCLVNRRYQANEAWGVSYHMHESCLYSYIRDMIPGQWSLRSVLWYETWLVHTMGDMTHDTRPVKSEVPACDPYIRDMTHDTRPMKIEVGSSREGRAAR